MEKIKITIMVTFTEHLLCAGSMVSTIYAYLISSLQKLYEVDAIVISTRQWDTLRFRKVTQPEVQLEFKPKPAQPLKTG